MKFRERVIPIKKEDIIGYIKSLKDYGGSYKPFQLYKEDFDSESVKSEGLLAIAKNFIGKKNTLFLTQIRKMADLFVKDELQFTVLTIDESNIATFSLPDDSIVSLEVDLSIMTAEGLKALQKRIQNFSKPIHNITLLGGQNKEEIRSFIESLYNVELINTNNEETKILANQITHRNHLIWALGVNVAPETDPWAEITKQLSKLPPYLYREGRGYSPDERSHRLYCRRFMSAIECHPEYVKTLKNSYGIATDKIIEVYSKNYERYNTINGCTIAMGNLFFEKMLENLDANMEANGFKEFEINIDLTDENLITLIA